MASSGPAALQIHHLDDMTLEHSPLLGGLTSLVDTVGTDLFGKGLRQLMSDVLQCEHVTLYEVSSAGQPRLVMAESIEANRVPESSAARYALSYWSADPLNDTAAMGDRLDRGVVAHRSARETSDCTYRQQCFEPADWIRHGRRLIERVSVMQRHQGRLVKVNFHRGHSAGPYSDTHIRSLKACAGLILALARRHAADVKAAAAGDPREQYMERLVQLCPAMPRRELEVAAGIVHGMMSEAIALDLGISHNTVLTYRKRCYTRLGISSQNELMRLVFARGLPVC
jgi:DNA-binding CsgD family transcriptional regulator